MKNTSLFKVLPFFFLSMLHMNTATAQGDNCSSATVLAVGSSTLNFVSGNTMSASQSVGIPASTCGTATTYYDVWYKATVPASGRLFVTTLKGGTLADDKDFAMQLYTGTCGALALLECNDNDNTNFASTDMPSISRVGLTPASTVYIRIWHVASLKGYFKIAATDFPLTTNDECSTATNITVGSSCSKTTYWMVDATASAVANPSCGTSSQSTYGYRDVWFKTTAPASGKIIINLDSLNTNDVAMSIYRGTCGALTEIQCEDDEYSDDPLTADKMPLLVNTSLIPGEDIYIRIWNRKTREASNFRMCVYDYAPACGYGNPEPTDLCTDAPLISNFDGFCGATYTAPKYTAEAGLPYTGCATNFSPTNTSWLKFIAGQANVEFTITAYACTSEKTVSTTDNGMQMTILDGDCAAGFNSLQCSREPGDGGLIYRVGNHSTQTISLTGLTTGKTYYVMFDGFANDFCQYTFKANFGILIVEAGADETICEGESISRVAQGLPGSTFDWYSDAAHTQFIQSGQTLNVTPTLAQSPKTYYLLSTNGVLSASDDFTVTVVSQPVVDAGSAQTIANGTNTALSGSVTGGSGPFTYLWAPSNKLSNANIQNPQTTNLATTTTYTLTITDQASSCYGTDQVIVTVNGVVLSTTASSTSSTICKGNSTQISCSPVGGSGSYTYSWSSNPAGFTATTINSTVSPTITTTYTVTVNDGFNTATNKVTVTVNPVLTIDAGSNASISYGTNTTLNATAAGGSGSYGYSWAPSGSLVSAIIEDPQTTNLTATTTYTVTANDKNYGCTNTDFVVITVTGSVLTASAGSTSNSICFNESSQLTCNVSGGTGVYNYSWSSNPAGFTSTAASPTVTPTITSTYTVTVSDGFNSVTTNTIVTVKARPTAEAGANKSIPYGTNTTINGSATGGTGSYNYAWSPSNKLTNAAIAVPQTTNLTTTTTYTLTVTDQSSGCTSTDQMVVTVTGSALTGSASSSDNTICRGESTQLNCSASGGSGNYTYSWSSNPSGFSATISNPFVSPTITTTYTVTINDGFNSATSSTLVTVNPLPLANVGSDQTINHGTYTTLSGTATGGSGSYTYTWVPANQVDNSTDQNPQTNNLTSTTTYTLNVTDQTTGCSSTDKVVITISGSALGVSAGSTASAICNGKSTQLSSSGSGGSGSYAYSWSSYPAGFSSTAQNPTVSPTISTVYTVTVNDGFNTATNSTAITVNALPAADAGANASVCLGKSTQLTAGGGNSYIWTPTNGLNFSTVYNPVASPTTTTTYNVQVTNAAGCTSTDNVIISVLTNPVAEAGANASICQGKSTQLSASGGTSFAWTPNTNLNFSNVFNPIASPTTTTTYTVLATNASGCSATDNVIVTVISNPIADAGQNTAICQGNTTQLAASGGASYQWSPTNGLNFSNVFNPVATPNNTTTYNVTVSSSNGCSASDLVTITVNNNPTANAGQDVTFCNGQNTQLNGSGGTTYQWAPSTGLNFTNTFNPVANPSSTTTYTLLVSNANGCSGTDYVIVNVNQLPSVNTNPDQTICLEKSVSLIATGASNYIWSPATGLNDAHISNPIATPSATTTYHVVGTDANGCSNSDQVTISVNSLPNAEAGSNQVVCMGTSISLNASGGSFYNWSPSVGLSANNINNPIANPTASSTYTLVVTDGNGCSSSDQLSIDVNPLPILNLSNNDTICMNDSAQIYANGGVFYTWSNGNSNANQMISPSTSTIYSVTATDLNGCYSTGSIEIIVKTMPIITLTNDIVGNSAYEGCTVTFTADPPSYSIYEFYVNDTLVQSTSSNIFATNNLNDGDMVSVVALENGCSSIQDGGNTNVIHVIQIPNAFTPNEDGVNDRFLKGQDIIILNRWGQEIYSGKEGWDGKYKDDYVNSATYFYILTLMDSENNKTSKTGTVTIAEVK